MRAYEQDFTPDLQQTITSLKNEHPDKISGLYITDIGKVDSQTYEDNDMQGAVNIYAEIYTYPQLLFWAYCSQAFRDKFTAAYKEVFRRVYHPTEEERAQLRVRSILHQLCEPDG